MYYIGESGNSASTRIDQHISAIRRFLPYLNYTSEVGYHFNLKGHIIKHHFRFAIFIDKIYDKEHRLSIEADLINIFHMLQPPIINKYIPPISKIKYPCFIYK